MELLDSLAIKASVPEVQATTEGIFKDLDKGNISYIVVQQGSV